VTKTAVIVFLAMIKVIAMKLAKFLIAKSLKLAHSSSSFGPILSSDAEF